MKTASLVALLLTIVALAFAAWGAFGVYSDIGRIGRGYEKADTGYSKEDSAVTREGLEEIRWALKNITICDAILTLGLASSFSLSVLSLVLSMLAARKKPNQSLQPTALLGRG